MSIPALFLSAVLFRGLTTQIAAAIAAVWIGSVDKLALRLGTSDESTASKG